MKIYICILLILVCYPIFGLDSNTTSSDSILVSKQDILEVYNTVKNLEHSDSLKTKLINNQKEIIFEQNDLIFNLKEKNKIDSMYVNLYKEQAKLNKPSLFERKELWFMYGVGLVLGSSWVIYNIK